MDEDRSHPQCARFAEKPSLARGDPGRVAGEGGVQLSGRLARQICRLCRVILQEGLSCAESQWSCVLVCWP
jgi:hypothetical protein